jgi:hypothetical protein
MPFMPHSMAWGAPVKVLWLLLLLLHDLIHGLGIVFHGLCIHVATALHAHGADLARHGTAGGSDAFRVVADIGTERSIHVHGATAGDGVLISGEEEELPAFLIAVEADEVADVLDGVFLGGVFFAIGEDGEDDFAGLVTLWQRGDAAVGFFDGAANGIEQSGAAAWRVGGGGELGHILNGLSGNGNLVSVIKLDEREAGIAGDIELGLDEVIEGGDGWLLHGLHGTGAVEDVGDFDEVWVHDHLESLTVGGTFAG